MRKKLLLIILPLALLTSGIQSQNKVWDFGNDTTNFPVNGAQLTETIVVDGLTLVPGGGSGFGIVEPNSSTWFEGTSNEYTTVNRFKSGGNSGIDPSGGEKFMPTRRYLSIPVDGPVAFKIWFRQSGSSTPRDLWITDGSAEVAHYIGLGDTDSQYLEANYTGGAGTLYVLFANNAYNLYKIEISSELLGLRSLNNSVLTSVKAIGSEIYVSNVTSNTEINIYSITGALVKSFHTNNDTNFTFNSGLYIATVKTFEGQKSVKMIVR